MDIKKLKKFLEELVELMNKNHEEGFTFFETEWSQFTFDEKRILFQTMSGIATQKFSLENIELEDIFQWLAILNHCKNHLTEDATLENDFFPGLALKKGKEIEILNGFHRLKKACIIESDEELIADAISSIFPIDYNIAYQYLIKEK